MDGIVPIHTADFPSERAHLFLHRIAIMFGSHLWVWPMAYDLTPPAGVPRRADADCIPQGKMRLDRLANALQWLLFLG